MVELGMRGIPV